MSQIDIQNDKKPKIFQFPKFSCIFVEGSADFVDSNVENGKQGTNVLSSMLKKEKNEVIQNCPKSTSKKMSGNKFKKIASN